jgi:enediyne biosynthesis protein E4
VRGSEALTLPFAALVLGLAGTAAGQAPPLRFVEAAADAGMTRVLLAGRPGKDHLLDSTGAGAAWLDYDLDGDLDAYLVNGWKLDGSAVVEKGRNALYRNLGNGRFEDATDRAGVAGEGEWGAGVAVADYDGDAWPDLLLSGFSRNVLYRNRGDGTFENVAAGAGIESPGWNTGAAFFDADADGDLDLYVATYISHSLDQVLKAQPDLDWKGLAKVAVGPFGLPGAADHYFQSDGKGRFTDATDRAGLTDKLLGYGLQVRAADLDVDGDPDLYVANDSEPNYLYRGRGDGTFEEVGLWTGAALSGDGAAQAGMGVTVGDANGDGLPDIFVTNFQDDHDTLYLGEGSGFFRDASDEAGVGAPTYRYLSWGTAFVDLDQDGDQDLVVANGHIYPQVEAHPDAGVAYRQRNLLLRNDGAGHFTDVTADSGPGFATTRSSRGLAVGDFDDDGDPDLLFTALDEPPSLLRNETSAGSWLSVLLAPAAGAGPAIGAKVTVRTGTRSQWRDVASGDSFLSSHDPRLHFGLATAAAADRVEVRWPDGKREAFEGVPVNVRVVVPRRPRG